MKRTIVLAIMASLAISACAGVPTSSELAQVPMVTFGEKIPANQDFILLFPAGQPISTDVQIVGTLLQQQASDQLTVTLKRDIYAYKNWVSFDGKNWIEAREALAVRFDVKLPGPKHPQPGYIRVAIDEPGKQ